MSERHRPRRAPTASPRSNQRAFPSGNGPEQHVARVIDELAEFDEFKATVLPKLRQMIKGNAPSKEILEAGRALVAARLATIAATEPDAKTALAAAKELLDRTDGKVTERREVEHKMAKLKDDELDALVLTAFNESEEGTSDDEG
jgi:hypothetical protein